MKLSVRVQPRARKSAITGIEEDVLRVQIKAPPVDGAANAELLRFLGREVLGVPPSSLAVLRGTTGRQKVVDIPDLTEEEVWTRIRRAAVDFG